MDDIRDIKPIFDLSDYYLTLLALLGAIALLIVIVLLLKKFFKRDKVREMWIKELKNIDPNSAKEAAYTITKYGRLVVKDEKNKEVLNSLIKKLETYKYRKDVPEKLDEESMNYYKLFMESIDG